jgi:pimeloyl-ACP methyl ester carboxylesterase
MADAPFISRFYTSSDGLKLHYRDYPGPAGAPFTVLCVPGLTRNARDFEELAPHLAQKYRVLCVDLRGRGLSEFAKEPATYIPPVYVRDMAALIDAAGLAQVALIGTSLGGIISMIMAGVMPARLLGVVLNDIGPEIDPAGLTRIAGYLGKTTPVTNWDDAAAAIQRLDGTIYPGYQPADWQKMARRRFVQAPDGSFRPDYDLNISKPFAGSTAAIDLWPFFRAMKRIPVLAIRGGTSDLLNPAVFARMKHELPHIEQAVVPLHGHAPYLDEPEALQAIDRFLAALPARLGPLTVLRRNISAAMFLIRLKITGVI